MVPFTSCRIEVALSLTLLVVPITIIAVSRRVKRRLILKGMIKESCVGRPNLRHSVLTSKAKAVVSTLVKNPPGAACNRGVNMLTVAGVCDICMLTNTTIVTVVFKFVNGMATLVDSVPAPMVNNISVLLFKVVTSSKLEVLISDGISFKGGHGLIVTSIVLMLKVNKTRVRV